MARLQTAVPKPKRKAKQAPSRLTRSGPPKRVNAKRKAKEFARAYGSKERVEWVRAQLCLLCGSRPCENAHIKTGGTGRKADARLIVPLCAECHRLLHRVGSQTFENLYMPNLSVGGTLAYHAALTDRRYRTFASQDTGDRNG